MHFFLQFVFHGGIEWLILNILKRPLVSNIEQFLYSQMIV